MRIYYDSAVSAGQRMAHSTSLKEDLFWRSTLGSLILFCALVIAVPVYFFPPSSRALPLIARSEDPADWQRLGGAHRGLTP
jgi:hypothetical protein